MAALGKSLRALLQPSPTKTQPKTGLVEGHVAGPRDRAAFLIDDLPEEMDDVVQKWIKYYQTAMPHWPKDKQVLEARKAVGKLYTGGTKPDKPVKTLLPDDDAPAFMDIESELDEILAGIGKQLDEAGAGGKKGWDAWDAQQAATGPMPAPVPKSSVKHTEGGGDPWGNIPLRDGYVEPQGMTKREAKGAARRGWKQGYRVNAYHGAGRDLRPERPRSNGRDPIRWFSKDAPTAFSYAKNMLAPTMVPVKLKLGKTLVVDGNGSTWRSVPVDGIRDKALKAKIAGQGISKMSTDSLVSEAKQAGYGSVTFRSIKDELDTTGSSPITDIYAIMDQRLIRGKHAKFANKNRGKLTDLLGAGAATIGTAAAVSQSDQTKET